MRNITVELGDFTILVGPNDSGKSSFLEALKIPSALAKQGCADFFTSERSLENLVWQKDTKRNITLEIIGKTADLRFTYRLEMSNKQLPCESLHWKDSKLSWTDIEIEQRKNIMGALPSVLEYRFDPRELAQPSVPQADRTLETAGANLAAVLAVLQNSDPPAFAAIQEHWQALLTLPGFTLTPAEPPGAKALEFILSEQPFVTIPASLASTGILLFTAFLTLAYMPTPEVLLLEGPEKGLHPSSWHWILSILRKMSRGEIGNRKRQIILVTYSPLVLNCRIQPEEVRIFIRHPEKGTEVMPLSRVPNIDRLAKEFGLGELWYLLGEEKLFEGKSLVGHRRNV